MRAYLELLRPANVVTALADVLAGGAVAYGGDAWPHGWLLVSTGCLYAGGVVLNDFFDRRIDAIERPERPIPSGRVPPRNAAIFGWGLIGAGVGAAAIAGPVAGAVALVIAALVVTYDAWAKHGALAPAVMGGCRAMNLLLGMAVVPAVVPLEWPIALIAWVHIAGVTMISRGEVPGGDRRALAAGSVAIALGGAGLAALAFSRPGFVAPFLAAFFAWDMARALWPAWRRRDPASVRSAVRAGVLALFVLDGAIAAACGAPLTAIVILALALAGRALSRAFAVT